MKRKWKILIYVLAAILLLAAIVVVFNQEILGQILKGQMRRQNIPGIGMALVDDNTIRWTKSFGVVQTGGHELVTKDTLFQAASVTKMAVAVLALHFADMGKIDLDRNINDYLQSWQLPDNGFTAERKVTLRLLLSHRSGLPEGDITRAAGVAPTLVQVLNGEAPARNKPARVEFIPGSRWQYSNIAYVLVQLLIEDLSGQPIARVMQDLLFAPLGMANSTLAYPLAAAMKDRSEALPHDGEGKSQHPQLHPTAVAQGGLITTPSDLAKLMIELMRAYQGQSDRILSRKTAKQMFHPEMALDPQWFGGIHAYQGLGVFIVKGKKFYILSVGNNAPGASCWLAGIPELGKGAVVMTNGQRGFDLSPKIIGALLITHLWPMPDL
ncbi:MAG: serine hydrolase domain-containing protein [Acidobacteriota bacterium]|jgi:CubicO group peptidase (beta-lactamase class C family)|nr:serine hydrolase domain-containing protein [Acidobacteriota bacterium]